MTGGVTGRGGAAKNMGFTGCEKTTSSGCDLGSGDAAGRFDLDLVQIQSGVFSTPSAASAFFSLALVEPQQQLKMTNVTIKKTTIPAPMINGKGEAYGAAY